RSRRRRRLPPSARPRPSNADRGLRVGSPKVRSRRRPPRAAPYRSAPAQAGQTPPSRTRSNRRRTLSPAGGRAGRSRSPSAPARPARRAEARRSNTGEVCTTCRAAWHDQPKQRHALATRATTHAMTQTLGRVVMLIGTSSAGKTTTAAALQSALAEHYLLLG